MDSKFLSLACLKHTADSAKFFLPAFLLVEKRGGGTANSRLSRLLAFLILAFRSLQTGCAPSFYADKNKTETTIFFL